MIAAHHHVVGAQRNMVLIIAFVFIQRVVLVDVLHIGRGLIGVIVARVSRFVVGRIALRIVDILIAAQNIGTHLVIILAAEVMIVVVSGVVLNGVPHIGTHNALRCR